MFSLVGGVVFKGKSVLIVVPNVARSAAVRADTIRAK
jgi:hypothetical protein